MAGLPALVVPCGFVKDGEMVLSMGLQMIGAAFEEGCYVCIVILYCEGGDMSVSIIFTHFFLLKHLYNVNTHTSGLLSVSLFIVIFHYLKNEIENSEKTLWICEIPMQFKALTPTTQLIINSAQVNVNMAGLPALVVPCGSVKDGEMVLSMGLQMIGAAFEEGCYVCCDTLL